MDTPYALWKQQKQEEMQMKKQDNVSLCTKPALAFSATALLATLSTAALAGNAHATDLYWGGGSTDIEDGTALPIDSVELSGVWNASLKNWAKDSQGTAYGAFEPGAILHMSAYTNAYSQSINNHNAYVALTSDAEIGGMAAYMTKIDSASGVYNHSYNITNTAGAALTIVGNMTPFRVVTGDTTRGLVIKAPISGNATIEKYGGGKLNFETKSPDYAGDMNVFGGTLSIGSQDFSGVKHFFAGSRLRNYDTGSIGSHELWRGSLSLSLPGSPSDNLADDAVVTLENGTFGIVISNNNSLESIGKIVLEGLGQFGHSNSSRNGVLVLADAAEGLSRGRLGMGVLEMTGNSTSAKGKLRVLNGLPVDTLLPWVVSSGSEFYMVDSVDNNNLNEIIPTHAETDLSLWASLYDADTSVIVGTNVACSLSGEITDDLAIRTLGFRNRAATTLAIADGKTLDIAEGGISLHAVVGTTIQTIDGGALTSSADTLYIHTGGGNSGNGHLVIRSPLVGDMNLAKSGHGQKVTLAGSSTNTYAGTTYVISGALELAKDNDVIAIPGDVVIMGGGSVNTVRHNQINTNANVTIYENGVLSLYRQTFNGVVTLEGGCFYVPTSLTPAFGNPSTGLVFNGGRFTFGSGANDWVDFRTDVSYGAHSATQAKFERNSTWHDRKASLRLGKPVHTFDIADSATLADGIPEMRVDFAIDETAGLGARLVKTGAGTLLFSATNAYTGGTVVNGGALRVEKISIPAQNGLTAAVNNYEVTFLEPVAGDMFVGQFVRGINANANTRITQVLSDYEIVINQSQNGYYEGVSADALERGGTLGTGDAEVNDTATLVIDAGLALANNVRVNAGGTLDASGAALGGVTVDTGKVVVRLGAEPLALAGVLSLGEAEIEIVGDISGLDTPVTVITAEDGVSGRFTVVPNNTTVYYKGNDIRVGKRAHTILIVR